MDNRPTIAEVQEWVLKLYNTCEQTITSEERKEQHKYAVMVQRPQDKKFLVEGGNLAASKIRNLECPNYEICLIDYGCGKFNRKIHIMEQYP